MTEPQQPQWSPPPQQPAGWGPGGTARPVRPTGVTLAAIFLIVMGVLQAIVGGACTLGAGAFTTAIAGSEVAAFAGIITLIFLATLILGVASIVAGAGVLNGSPWARSLGIGVSVTVIVLQVIFIALFVMAGADISSQLFSIVVVILYALSAYALYAARPYFAYGR